MQMARESLKGKWGLALGTFLLYSVIVGAAGSIPFTGGAASLIIGGPFLLGITMFTLSLSRKQDPRLEQMFFGFKDFGRALATYLLMVLFIVLWMLLLIVPGIIAALSYSMTFYIIADDNTIKPMDALRKSKKMMFGYKAKLFGLCLRFTGWFLLCILTLGIGFLWLVPYINVSVAKFYDDIKDAPVNATDNTTDTTAAKSTEL